MSQACYICNLQMLVSDGRGGQRIILDVPRLDIAQGSFIAIAGASGSGKTTLLHCFTGIHRSTAGSVRMQGAQLDAFGESECDAWRRTHVGLIFQDFQLVSEMTALENVLLPTHFARNTVETNRASALMNSYGITEQHVPVTLMSRGEQQRVAFARALLFNPPFIIADEPTASLDRDNAISVIEALKLCATSGQTVIVATHDADILAIADRVITLAHGRIVEPHKVAAA